MHGALYSPLDGNIDPSSACAAYTKAAKNFGARVSDFPYCLYRRWSYVLKAIHILYILRKWLFVVKRILHRIVLMQWNHYASEQVHVHYPILLNIRWRVIIKICKVVSRQKYIVVVTYSPIKITQLEAKSVSLFLKRNAMSYLHIKW